MQLFSSPPQAALNCSTPPFLSAALWMMPRIVLSLSELSAACLITRDTVYLHTDKSFMLNRSRSCLLCSEEFKKSWTTNSFSCFFLNAEIFTSCLNLAETSFTEHVFKKSKSEICRQGIRKSNPSLEGRCIDSLCSHLITVDAAFGFVFIFFLSLAASGSILHI